MRGLTRHGLKLQHIHARIRFMRMARRVRLQRATKKLHHICPMHMRMALAASLEARRN